MPRPGPQCCRIFDVITYLVLNFLFCRSLTFASVTRLACPHMYLLISNVCHIGRINLGYWASYSACSSFFILPSRYGIYLQAPKRRLQIFLALACYSLKSFWRDVFSGAEAASTNCSQLAVPREDWFLCRFSGHSVVVLNIVLLATIYSGPSYLVLARNHLSTWLPTHSRLV